MSFLDKLLGRGKPAAGDTAGDPGMRREGTNQEKEGKAEDRAAANEEHAPEARERDS